MAYVEKDKTTLISRRNRDITRLYPELQTLFKTVKQPCVLDSEIVYINDENKPEFSVLLARNIASSKEKIKKEMQIHPVKLMVFDILVLNKKDVVDLPLLKRKKLLKANVKSNNWVEVIPFALTYGKELFDLVKKEDLEGIVAKKTDSKYCSATRTTNWIKIKNFKEKDFYAVALIFEKTEVKYILLAQKINNEWVYYGKIYCPNPKDKLYLKKFAEKNKGKSLFKTEFKNEVWIKPKLKITVSYIMLTKSGNMRSPTYRGIVETKE